MAWVQAFPVTMECFYNSTTIDFVVGLSFFAFCCRLAWNVILQRTGCPPFLCPEVYKKMFSFVFLVFSLVECKFRVWTSLQFSEMNVCVHNTIYTEQQNKLQKSRTLPSCRAPALPKWLCLNMSYSWVTSSWLRGECS